MARKGKDQAEVKTECGQSAATLYGWTEYARDPDAARAAVIAKIEKAAAVDYTPRRIVWRGWLGLIVGTPNGYEYSTIRLDDMGPSGRTDAVYTSGQYDTFSECESRCRYMLARRTWTVDDEYSLPSIMSYWETTDSDRSDYLDWARLETYTALYVARGFDRDRARQLAAVGSPEDVLSMLKVALEPAPAPEPDPEPDPLSESESGSEYN